IGARIGQGETGWELLDDSKSIAMLSPVNGEVIAVNEEIIKSPDLINQDPYEKGWLLKVRAPRMKTDLKNLLHGKLAGAWIEETVDALRERISGDLGVVLQDGGVPVVGIAKSISPDKWDEIVSEFFLSK
ncbi:MAG: glycine cleavage system protein H, partial [Bacteroidota bacterium]